MSPVAMMMTRPCTIVHVVYEEPDAAGDMVRDVTLTDALCALQQSRAQEIRDGRLVSVTEWNLFGFRDAETGAMIFPDLTGGDEIDVEGVTYTLDGDPWRVDDPLLGAPSHIEARARQVG